MISNINIWLQDQPPLDLSTAPSSSSNYFQQNQQQQGPNNISNQFWGEPATANTSTSNYSQLSSFTPLNTANSSTSTIPTTSQTTRSQFDQFNQRSQFINNDFNNQSNPQFNEKEERLKIDLKIKESQIESLENEIQRLSESQKILDNKSRLSNINQQLVIPKNINEIFTKLTTNYNKLELELQDTKKRLESLITAISLNPSNSITNNGRYDELEISHKIILKLDLLKKENEELLNQLSFGKSKEVDIELNLLKMENEQLKEKLKSFESK
ncbi:DNA double-strand break repair rad50 ATPase [Wickerhamomyces ciferrii]|uniref:DNA double-strand break repair rad50 ATPase n=1 Tax=Wickerhamomyces ciferrii (strain ATCC 14091 / BCRC 22168 / CBS 111 / JCM 3599 / NBRC 0793 / NRRL Y-1031 F-60-10) TaxID=1206466 RepID=K0L0S0_WICCF|nr:DNA double-strand break repair rad50 ATPase [Wickerhamomyces ciferrii]CCH47164.1 DNA double-strand break repair rad50 ATPase [Wickerhamomyces ciferrii]